MTQTIVKPSQVMLGLPAERLAQLRTLARNQGTTTVGVVERMLRRAIEEGDLEDTLPGFCEIDVTDEDEMIVTIRGVQAPPLDRGEALLFAAVVDAAAGHIPLPGGGEFGIGTAFSLPLSRGGKLCVGRHVRAVILALADGTTSEIMFRTATTASIAIDFARLLRKRANAMAQPIFHETEDGKVVPTEAFKRLAILEIAAPGVRANGEAR